jgi:glycosyltransferase involved in cell wall biosynthesis
MSVGLPVIVADLGYTTGLISDAKEGFRIPPNDAEAACRYILEFANNESRRMSMGSKALQMAKRYSISNQVQRFSDLAYQAMEHFKSKQI